MGEELSGSWTSSLLKIHKNLITYNFCLSRQRKENDDGQRGYDEVVRDKAYG